MQSLYYRYKKRAEIAVIFSDVDEAVVVKMNSRRVGRIDTRDELEEGVAFEVGSKTIELQLDKSKPIEELEISMNGVLLSSSETKDQSLATAGGTLTLYGIINLIGGFALQDFLGQGGTIASLIFGAVFIFLGLMVLLKDALWAGWIGVGVTVVVLLTGFVFGDAAPASAVIPLVVIFAVVKNILSAERS